MNKPGCADCLSWGIKKDDGTEVR